MKFRTLGSVILTCNLVWAAVASAQSQWIPGLGPASRPAWVGPMSPEVLPGIGAAEHPFFYTGQWDFRKAEQTMYIVREGKIAWSYSIPSKDKGEISELTDATLLSDDSVVFARKTGAGKVTADGKLIWDYEAPKGFEVHVAQPIGLDRVLMIQNGRPATLMVINLTTGKTETQFTLTTNPQGTVHLQFRRARMTAAGTFLVCHKDMDKIVEYDAAGKEIWSVAVPVPWSAVRLKSGNTLVASGSTQVVREFNPSGDVVWEFSQKDVPDIQLFSLQEANRLANGNTVISNWCPSAVKDPKDWPKTVQVLELTPQKKLVWALRSWDPPAALGPATVIQLLDEPGIPEKLEQQR
jgi:Mala s 1-like protein